MAKKEFPEIKEKNQGKFTAWAKRNGFKDACSAASAVMKNKDIINNRISNILREYFIIFNAYAGITFSFQWSLILLFRIT